MTSAPGSHEGALTGSGSQGKTARVAHLQTVQWYDFSLAFDANDGLSVGGAIRARPRA